MEEQQKVEPPPGLMAGMTDEEEEDIEVTIDSGAVDTVGPPSVGKAFKMYRTEASEAGRHFRAANGSMIINHGEKKITGCTEDGRKLQMRMTVADVGKVLMSVAKACESGYRIVFDEEGSYMEEKRTGLKTSIHKKNGVYVMSMRTEGGERQEDEYQEVRRGKNNRKDFRWQGTQTHSRP